MSSKKEPSADERFACVKKDPRFWEMPDTEQKVRIDKRFQSMFHDERFKLKYTVDKRGRPVNHTSTEDLKRFYKLSDSEQSDSEAARDEQQEKKKKKKKKKKMKAQAKVDELQDKEKEIDKGEEPVSKKTIKKMSLKSECETIRKAEPVKGVKVVEEEDDDDVDDDDEEYSDTDNGKGLSDDDDDDDVEVEDDEDGEDDDEDESESEDDSDSGPDLARGKGNIETSSEDEDDDDEEDLPQNEEEEIEHDWGEMWKDAPCAEQVSSRLAVCNMNWDRIKAKDLLALFGSFKPNGGAVLSVTIYLSEFGKERLKVEQTQGPMELTSLPDDPDADTEDQR
ncbi:ESF1 homolog isoform X1 [Tachysurus ichikawai]